MENNTAATDNMTFSSNFSSDTVLKDTVLLEKSSNTTPELPELDLSKLSELTTSILKSHDVTDSPVIEPNMELESNVTFMPDDVIHFTDQSTPILGTKVDDSESSFDTTYIAAIVCFGVGAIVLTIAFVRLGVWAHRYRRKKEHKKWWERQLEHKRHLDDYSIKTEIASQHSMTSIATQEEEKEKFHEEEKEEEKEEEDVPDDTLPRKDILRRPRNPELKVAIPKNEIEAIIGTAESRKSVRRSFYGVDRSTLPPGGSLTLDLGVNSPGNRRSFFMNMNSGTLQY